MSHIKSRSPYFIADNVTNLVSATLELYIYTGQQTVARPSSPTYTLFSTAINEEVVFEVGQLINDKVQFVNDNTYRTDGVWVDYQVTRTLSDGSTSPQTLVQKYAIDGYTYYEEGANYTYDVAHLLSVDAIRVLDGEEYKVAINKNYEDNGVTIDSITTRRSNSNYNQYTVSSSDLSGQVIHYYSIPYDVDNTAIRIRLSDSSKIDIPITYESECKFDAKKLTFINRYKSPLAPPLVPASPFPANLILVPSSTPFGIVTDIFFEACLLPWPLQSLHGFVISSPLPAH